MTPSIEFSINLTLCHLLFIVAVAAACGLCTVPAEAKRLNVTLCCREDNDLNRVLADCGYQCDRYSNPKEAVDHAQAGSGVLILADGYPEELTEIDAELFGVAKAKSLRMYIEYPAAVPGLVIEAPRETVWERAVVASDSFGKDLARLRIVAIHDCHYTPTSAADPMLVVARVAGFDTAVYGLPEKTYPLLFKLPDGDVMVATTKLSCFVSGRYAPTAAWRTIWQSILALMDPASPVDLQWTPTVHPAYKADEILPANAERRAVESGARWYLNSHLLVSPGEKAEIDRQLLAALETRPTPGADAAAGDGSLGILEGFAAEIKYDGNQLQRLPIRSDCHAEVAMALAVNAKVNGEKRDTEVAKNILDYMLYTSNMHGGDRGNPKHPAFGLIAWGTIAPAWEVANYGDDDARVILGTITAAATLGTDKYDERVMRMLLANLRTTGRKGFRGERIDMGPIAQNGWKAYHDADLVHISPHFESYLWACNLWAYRQTGYRPFLEKASSAIRMTMDAYPDGWRIANGLTQERSRMLLCLAWLIRLEDTPEHRGWLKKMAKELISSQDACGAFQEQLGKGPSWAGAPQSNEAYGTGEAPLIHENGDPISDQLYTSGFALLGLHEAVAATGDAEIKQAEDKLAAYLCRIQVRSKAFPYLDGTWFRAFDYKRWDYWASSSDIGWGAWSAESGWGPAWITAILGMRVSGQSVWDITAKSKIADHFDEVQKLMAENDGGPWSANGN